MPKTDLNSPLGNMNPRPIDTDLPSDENLQAFRYVAGEMSADEEAVFEELLIDSQQLREELAEMVGLTAVVASAFPEIAEPSAANCSAEEEGDRFATNSPSWNWSLPLALAAGFSAVALMAGWYLSSGPQDSPSAPLDVASVGPLAEAWSEVALPQYGESPDESDFGSEAILTNNLVAPELTEWSTTEFLEADSELLAVGSTGAGNDVPDWMASAVMGLDSAMKPESNMEEGSAGDES
jgi:hypothetical protein